jgi:tetratricopeptide (TPR) repeat protein
LGQTAEAITLYDRLIAIDPTSAVPRINRAGLLAAAGRAAEAEREYRQVLAAHRVHRGAAIGLHELLQQQQRFADLIDLWSNLEAAEQEPGESRAWLTWAYVLAADSDQARLTADAVPRSAQARRFAGWALAYDALRGRNHEAFRRVLGVPRPPGVVPSVQREQARIVIAALSSLPRDVRESPAGLYALARAMLFAGDTAAARTIATQALAGSEAGPWREATQRLVEMLDAPRRQQPLPPTDGGG